MSSRRQYLSQAELEEYADIDVIDLTEADDQISQAEEMIDSYVGAQDKFIGYKRGLFGVVTAATATTLSDTSGDTALNTTQDDYFTYAEVEIVTGTGAGQKRTITANDGDSNRITIGTAWTTTPDTTSSYRIYQLGKFPRRCDVFFDADNQKYHKAIPEAVRRAVAAQVQFVINKGPAFFAGDASMKQSETISDYSYTMGSFIGTTPSVMSRLIAPKAKILLRGIMNRKGRIIA